MTISTFPHCDQRILHKPGECEFCDEHPDWQELRKAWGIAFTGHVPAIEGDRCGKRIRSRIVNLGPHASDWDSQYCRQGAGHDGPCLPTDPLEALPCPADYAVTRGERGDHQRWPGNRPEGRAGAAAPGDS